MDYLEILKKLDSERNDGKRVKTPKPRQIERQCWHCNGSATCGCISCAEGLQAGEEAQCKICKGSGKLLAWVD